MAAEGNRLAFDQRESLPFKHPENCECTCEHRDPEQWQKQFSVEQP